VRYSSCFQKETSQTGLIEGRGYRVAVEDPYRLTLTKGDSIIDFYVHPSLGGVIFINGQGLLERVYGPSSGYITMLLGL